MKDIFVDSLRRHSNVCNGCFKTIYTMAIELAEEAKVGYVVTGLSKGQLFETRAPELFREVIFDAHGFEKNLLDARKIYHRMDDAVTQLLGGRCVNDPSVLERVRFVDFYRYCHVHQDDIYRYINQKVGWDRPADTGRSTNCLINDVGIYVHNRERGYHNYAIPYSWDVRMGHVTRDRAMRELDDLKDMDTDRVHAILREIGYEAEDQDGNDTEGQLVAYYVASTEIDAASLRHTLSDTLPDYMIPDSFVHLDQLPVTPNGKLNRRALPRPRNRQSQASKPPATAVERELAALWKSVLDVDAVGTDDNFFECGGHSLGAILLLSKIDARFNRMISTQEFFTSPTIRGLAGLLLAVNVTAPS